MSLWRHQLSLSCDFLFFSFFPVKAQFCGEYWGDDPQLMSPRQLTRGERRKTWHLQKRDHNGGL